MSKQRCLPIELGMERLASRVPGNPRWNGSAQDIADIAIDQYGSIQKPKEFGSFLEMVQQKQPKTIVEIGTQNGGTLFGLAQVAHKDALLVSIDLPNGGGGGGYGLREEQAIAARRVDGQTMRFIRGNSQNAKGRYSTYGRLQRILGGRAIDCLFIDGDHTRTGVRGDYDLYAPLVATGGIIGIHDIVPNPYNDEIEVDQVWPEIQALHINTSELVQAEGTRILTEIECAGIGVIFK